MNPFASMFAWSQPPISRCCNAWKKENSAAILYFRLAVFPVQTPSLAERRGDIPELAMYFLEKLGQTGPSKVFHPEAMEKLCSHTWPGNVRELGHVVERAYILAEDRLMITAEEIRMRSRERTMAETRF